jgi:hypothetical protein
MAVEDQALAQAAQRMRNAAPQAFDQFRDAFGQYTGVAVKNLLDATTNLDRWQGQAQQCNKLFQILDKIV